MGEHAEDIINGDVDAISGEWLGNGQGFPRTRYTLRKSEDHSWKKVDGYMGTMGIKAHLRPQLLKEYGCTYTGKHPYRNACFEILKDFNKFKTWLSNNKTHLPTR